MRAAAALLALIVTAASAAAQDFPSFERRMAPAPHAAMSVGPPHPVRLSGMETMRVELRPGECGAPCPADTERAEWVETGPGQPLGAPTVTALSVLILRGTATTPGNPVTLARFEQAGRRLLAVEWRDEGLVATGEALSAPALLVAANLMASRWQDIVVEQRWSAGADGYIRLWINGARGPAVSGANVAGTGGVTFAYGMSRGAVSAWTARTGRQMPAQIVYFANVRRDPDRGVVDIDLRVR